MNARSRLLLISCALGFPFAVRAPFLCAEEGPAAPPPPWTSLPEPPQQKAPWTPPPAAFPESFISACRFLFDQGLADPRGCEYREAQIVVGNVERGMGAMEFRTVHAWALPPAEGGPQRWAVGWNGLVYPALAVGDKADLEADVRRIVEADAQTAARYARDQGQAYVHRRRPWDEGMTASHDSLLPIKACLLFRVGEEALARRVWTAWTAGSESFEGGWGEPSRDPFLMLADDWMWALSERALAAHIRGDDRLALLDARRLAAVRRSMESEADRRGYKRRPDFAVARQGQFLPLLKPVTWLPSLIGDQERRAKAPTRRRALDLGPGAFPNKPQWIAALVEDLDEVASGKGYETVEALVKEGDPAVARLLFCLETDTRLTRQVETDTFHGGNEYRRPVGVHELAFRALTRILRVPSAGLWEYNDDLRSAAPEARKRVGDALRRQWKEFKGAAEEEVWYRVLAKDDATAEQWAEVARNIVQKIYPSTGQTWGTAGPNEVPRLRGEALRTKTEPGVSDLLVTRMRDLAARTKDVNAAHHAGQMADALAAWDGKAHLDELREVTEALKERAADPQNGHPSGAISAVVSLCLRRAELGDDKAIGEYADWAATLGFDRAVESLHDVFDGLWIYSDHPAVLRASEALFSDPKSPWVPILQTRGSRGAFWFSGMVHSPLLGVPAFRQALQRGLGDRSKAGTVKLREGGDSLDIRLDNGG